MAQGGMDEDHFLCAVASHLGNDMDLCGKGAEEFGAIFMGGITLYKL